MIDNVLKSRELVGDKTTPGLNKTREKASGSGLLPCLGALLFYPLIHHLLILAYDVRPGQLSPWFSILTFHMRDLPQTRYKCLLFLCL